MTKKKIQAQYDALRAEKQALEDKIRDLVFNILNQLPRKCVSFVDNHAYCYVEGYENWIEVPVYGARIKDGSIELSLEIDYDMNKDKDVPSWAEADVRAENDNYTDINWLTILYSLT